MKTAVLYLLVPKDQQHVLIPQAVALDRFCKEYGISVMDVFMEIEDGTSKRRRQRSNLLDFVYERRIMPDYILFTTIEVFADDITELLKLQHQLSLFDVILKSVSEPNIIIASLPKLKK